MAKRPGSVAREAHTRRRAEPSRSDDVIRLDITEAPELVALAGIEPSALYDGTEPIILECRPRLSGPSRRSGAHALFGMMAAARDAKRSKRKSPSKKKAPRRGR